MKVQECLMMNMKLLCKKRGLSYAKLAELCNLTPNYIGELANGHKFPSAKTIDSLAQAFDVAVFVLFLDAPNSIPDKKVLELCQNAFTELLESGLY